jgi:hypothetical protein
MRIFGRNKRPLPATPIDQGATPEEYIAVEEHGSTGESDTELLSLLNRPRPISSHLEHLANAGWVSDDSIDTEEKIRDLIERGLVVSKTEILQALRLSRNGNEKTGEITTMVWPTHNRIFELERSIRSYATNVLAHGRRVRYFVANSHYDNRHEKDLKAALAALAEEVGIEISYAGQEEKRRYCKLLGDALRPEGIDPSLVEFGFFDTSGIGSDFGANRNATLLATVGELVMTADDDTLCEFAMPTDRKQIPEHHLTSAFDPTTFHFFSTRDGLLGAMKPCDVDLLSMHETMLGRPAGLALDSHSAPPPASLDITDINPAFASSILKTKPRIAATMTGLYGVSGLVPPLFLLALQGTARDDICKSMAAYDSAFQSREVCRSVSRRTVSSGRFLMTTNLGLDNRVDLPPFFPVFRSEDGIFGNILRICLPDYLIGYHSSCLYHAPLQSRRYDGEHPSAPRFSMPSAVQLAIESFAKLAAAPPYTSGMEHLGAFFTDIGSLSYIDFVDFFWEAWTASVGSYLGRLEALLELHRGRPRFWADDVHGCVENSERMLSGGMSTIEPLVEGQSFDEALKICRRLFARFGELLTAWKIIRRCAKTLNESGQEMGRSVSL